MFVSSQAKQRVQFVKATADASFLWLQLKDVVLGCPEVYLLCMLHATKTAFQQDHTYSQDSL